MWDFDTDNDKSTRILYAEIRVQNAWQLFNMQMDHKSSCNSGVFLNSYLEMAWNSTLEQPDFSYFGKKFEEIPSLKGD